MRGESNVQGSTDHCLLVHILPGYLGTPTANLQTLEEYNKAKTPTTNDPKSPNWWGNFPKYSVSLLKAFWPEVDHKTSYNWLPKGEVGKKLHLALHVRRDDEGAPSRAFSRGARTRHAAEPTPTRVAKPLASWTGWSTSICSTTRPVSFLGAVPGMDPKKIKTRGLFPALLRLHREGRLHHQLRVVGCSGATRAPSPWARPSPTVISSWS